MAPTPLAIAFAPNADELEPEASELSPHCTESAPSPVLHPAPAFGVSGRAVFSAEDKSPRLSAPRKKRPVGTSEAKAGAAMKLAKPIVTAEVKSR